MQRRRSASASIDGPLTGWPDVRVVVAMCALVALFFVAVIVKQLQPAASSTSASPAVRSRAAQLDACAYFTLDDARSLFGPDAEQYGPPGPLGGCAFDSAPWASWPRPTQVVVIVFDGKPASPDAMYDGPPSTSDRAIAGVGRSARWYSYGKDSFGMLDVRHGHYTVRIWVGDATGHSSGSNQATAIAATQLAIARLPAT